MVGQALPVIAMFWKGSELGWFERLSIHSFLHQGHVVKLFHTDPMDPQIDGLELVPVQEVYDPPRRLAKNAAPSFLADIFRLYLMKKTDYVWMDSDILAVRPVSVQDGYAISWSGPNSSGQINNATLRLPSDSAALDHLLEHIENPEIVPEWMNADQRRIVEKTPVGRRLLKQGKLLRIVYGPRGLNHALQKTGEHVHARPMEVYSPVPWWLSDLFFAPPAGVEAFVSEDTQVVHLFKDQMRKYNARRQPPEGSYLDLFAKSVGFEG